MLIPFLFGLLFLMISVLVVGAPLQRQRRSAAARANSRVRHPSSSYEATLLALRDLEFDQQMGVVADEDYGRLRADLLVRAAADLERAQQAKEQGVIERIEAAISARRQSRPSRQAAALFCTQCGQQSDPDDRFCANCGATLSPGADDDRD